MEQLPPDAAKPANSPTVPLDKQHEYAGILRTISQHEDGLVNNRFTWFSTLQGLLFAALAFIWKESDLAASCLIGVVCWLGFVVAFSTRTTIKHADGAHNKIRDWWQAQLATYTGPGRTGSEMDNVDLWDMTAKTPWYHVPSTFMGAWVIIFGLFLWSKLSPKKEASAVVTIQAAQATIAIQQWEQATKQVAPTTSAPADTVRAHRTTTQRLPAGAASSPSALSSH